MTEFPKFQNNCDVVKRRLDGHNSTEVAMADTMGHRKVVS